MKNLIFLLLLVGLTTAGVNAKPRSSKKAQPKQRLEQQLTNYISYPDVLQDGNREGVVVVQFKVNEENRMSQVAVLSQDEKLNNSLIKQLTGKKIEVAKAGSQEMHTVRLRFQLD
ncbi:energy transducer TonB [Tellurirhabdus rosea]|uniref:energy transducer TonB n=1 Tax=Tellurirhabdus rosea TaxID=2674997 RepID=UPI002251FA11|nr:energy transducer TonB [Tellurirhabdus rosea]